MTTKILLADDETDLEDLFIQQFRRQIQNHTYEFIFVRNGREALAVLEQQPDIDVVLSDINMPGMDGLTLLARLPEINPIIRTVMVTAYGDMNNIRTAMNRGAFDFVTKPINFQDLRATIEKTIRHVQQLRETAELKAMDELKTRFFANITHELRTPLTLIVSPVDKLLETPDLPVLYQQQLSTVRRNALQLLRLINQLLDINKLEARQMELVQEVGDLPRFVGQVVELFRPSTDIKQLTLTYQSDMVSGNHLFDAGKWETILFNLLSNAIKFTHTGEITVHLAQMADTALLTVRDTGIGISADKLPHIFDRFWQADNARTRVYEGTGIGLALVHELTYRLGGTIRVDSQVTGSVGPVGTCFVLAIPIQSINDPLEALRGAAGRHPAQPVVAPTSQIDLPYLTQESTNGADVIPPGQQPLVLIVVDNAELRDFMVAELATTYRMLSAD
ncbi:MAG: HAMP domain-containing histidine kinase, partial [Spirosoma sp.]|nr:HAMP domain-containing histidine kinase [Spirosoma sp.]